MWLDIWLGTRYLGLHNVEEGKRNGRMENARRVPVVVFAIVVVVAVVVVG